jgi:hypothetical protein
MDTRTFQRLTENIKNNAQLESLPYCHKTVSPGGSEEFSIISGHHRVRAARKAGFTEIFVLVDRKDLTSSQVKAKQLAHNSLAGVDDQQMLQEIFASIDDVNAKLEAGIFIAPAKEIDVGNFDALTFEFSYEQVNILFLRREYEDFTALLAEVEEDLKTSSMVGLADLEDFGAYRKMIQEVTKRHNVRNIGAVMARITQIVRAALKAKDNPRPRSRRKPSYNSASPSA